jgi:hypothetical protein
MGAVASLPVTLRRLSVLSALLLCGAASMPAVRAQGAAPRPATDADMGLYTRIGAVNACIAASNGVDFNKAVGIASETVTQVLQGQHGGIIQPLGPKPLPVEDLRKGSVNSVLIGISQMCPDSMPADVRDQVQKAVKGAAGGGAKGAPKPGKAQ